MLAYLKQQTVHNNSVLTVNYQNPTTFGFKSLHRPSSHDSRYIPEENIKNRGQQLSTRATTVSSHQKNISHGMRCYVPSELYDLLNCHHRTNGEGIQGLMSDIPKKNTANMDWDTHILKARHLRPVCFTFSS